MKFIALLLCLLNVKYVLSNALNIGVEFFFPESTNEDLQIKKGRIFLKSLVEYDFDIFTKSNSNPSYSLTYIKFTNNISETSKGCSTLNKSFNVKKKDQNKYETRITLTYQEFDNEDTTLYLCAGFMNNTANIFWVTPLENNVSFFLEEKALALPLYLSILIITALICLSALFSGLNIGLMSLNSHDLKILASCGDSKKSIYAKNILPLRCLGNVLLVTILFSNTAVNSSLTILMDTLTSGTIAIIGSTLSIMIFGEILPQALCSKYPLLLGSYTRYIMWFFIVITFPISYPMGKLLNMILGDETLPDFGRNQLTELIKIHANSGDFEKDELGIIAGALNFKKKVVLDIMMPLENCFMLIESAILDFDTIAKIVRSGFSRIPIYSFERHNIVGLLHLKDLTFIDPDDKLPLLSIVRFYKRSIIRVFSDITLDKVFVEFKSGAGHMAIVCEIENVGEMDLIYKAIGVVTLEDIIEEILQDEIVDETDAIIDLQGNIKKSTLLDENQNFDKLVSFFYQDCSKLYLTPNMILSVCQFLSAKLGDYFSEDLIPKMGLQTLVSRYDVVEKYNGSEVESVYLYKNGESSDMFTLILEGRVSVIAGVEQITSILGPFSYFGTSCLTMDNQTNSKRVRNINFIPDFSVKALNEVTCIRIPSALYFKAIKLKMNVENEPSDF